MTPCHVFEATIRSFRIVQTEGSRKVPLYSTGGMTQHGERCRPTPPWAASDPIRWFRP